MGLEFLDMIFRLEKSFGLKFDKGFLNRLPQGDAEPASFWDFGRFVDKSSNPKWRYERRVPVVTAGDVHLAVCDVLTEKSVAVPSDSWQRVRAVLSDVTGHDEEEIKPESLLFQDLGFG